MRHRFLRPCCTLLLLALVGASVAASAARSDEESLTKAQAVTEAREALKATYGKKWTRGRDKRLRCERTDDEAFRCPARWKYRGRSFRRTVLVVDRDGTVSVSIFPG